MHVCVRERERERERGEGRGGEGGREGERKSVVTMYTGTAQQPHIST